MTRKPTPRRSPAGGCYIGDKFYRGGQFLPAHGDVETTDERAIAAELSRLTLGDHVYAESMAATLRGSKAVRHKQVLKSRRLQAISRLVERADWEGNRRARNRLHEIHQRTLQGVLSLAGC